MRVREVLREHVNLGDAASRVIRQVSTRWPGLFAALLDDAQRAAAVSALSGQNPASLPGQPCRPGRQPTVKPRLTPALPSTRPTTHLAVHPVAPQASLPMVSVERSRAAFSLYLRLQLAGAVLGSRTLCLSIASMVPCAEIVDRAQKLLALRTGG
jgi:hypothetical protein